MSFLDFNSVCGDGVGVEKNNIIIFMAKWMRISTNILDLSWTNIEFIDLECRARFASFLMFDSHATPHICSGLCVKNYGVHNQRRAWVITTQAQGNQFN